MCGRFTMSTPSNVVADFFGLGDVPDLEPSYNIAPTQQVSIVRADESGNARVLASVRWGLVPAWARDLSIGARLINARAETVATKPSFRSALRRRRCLVIADGFFEWRKDGVKKQPVYVRMVDETPFAFAGLWERWISNDSTTVDSCTIITTEPNALLKPIHNRMPVILPPEAFSQWLNPDQVDLSKLTGLLKPCPADLMIAMSVGSYVNNARNNGPECVVGLP